MLADGGALDVDRCPDCWERRAHIERYVWAAKVCVGMYVLDFGCGTGYGSEILRGSGNWVVSYDPSLGAAAVAAKNGRANLRCLAAFQGEACVAFEVLEHLPDPAEFIRTVKARHLIASVPVRPDDNNPHHKQHFTIESFKALVEKRFKIVSWWIQVEPYHSYPSVVVVHGQER